ncbi:SgcJ/EcaC family oxidoreductase [Actinospica sp. MGRD01-02]|uniref:SgcJ/EcaC family oxidoreductase n=1 Tax=Actinospica acidithermotolerans TaxID=2828514 RepID=A0A941IKR7_9ACTN|nr:SgcJ/EcaC family oxidoreductase [Actinospica acidithermotolerans]MBR7830909.1 SgcJ/EcaC family oxidoreductase [Actinospica acidithermotolerans]
MNTQTLDAARLPFVYEQALNAGDVDAVLSLFEPEATMRTVTGEVIAGEAKLRAETLQTIATKAHLTNRERHTLIAGDTALLIVDWTLTATLPDGTSINPTGTTTAVARRTPDGSWRFAVLNPLGIA